MKDKIIKLQSGEEYYILEELNYEDKKYVLGSQCDLEKDEINKEEFALFNVDIKDNNLVINNVDDKNLANIVTEKLVDKIKNS